MKFRLHVTLILSFLIFALLLFMKICRSCKLKYRIYLIKRPGRLFNFWTLRVGAYSRWVFIQGWALIKFSPFSASSKFIL